MNKKTIIFIAAFAVFMLVYPKVLKVFYPNYDPNATQTQSDKSVSEKVTATGSQASSATPAKADQLPTQQTSAGTYDLKNDVIIQTKTLKLTINKSDAAIRKVEFLDFENSLTKDPIYLFDLRSPMGATLDVDVIGGDQKRLQVISPWQIMTAPGGYKASADLQGGIKITKTLVFDNSNKATFKINLNNATSETKDIYYRVYAGAAVHPRNSVDTQYIESNFYKGLGQKDALKHIRDEKAGKKITSDSVLEWLAIKDRHFSVILKPNEKKFTGVHEGLGNHQFSSSLISQKLVLSQGAFSEDMFTVYMGSNDLEKLEAHGLQALVNFGKMDAVARLLVGILEMLQGVFKNYGLAIIVLTAFVNFFLFPFTRMSFQSMRRMQELQPQINRLRDQYSKSPEKLNREMMELYKKNKVNPMAGCLPLLLQMPIFIALYVAISKCVPLVNAKFLWIQDLSAPDVVGLPFSLPFLGDKLHLLPIIMIVGMVAQQKISSANMPVTDPAMASQQKMMLVIMPIVFGFLFYTMPSGLVLYWLTNTIIMTAYQLFLKKSSAPPAVTT